ncbi:MAG: membrane protein insertase YidC [Elusimicrobia bacterium]|nr:membrane protein insertase YidC [Elusimicrobiota bacterium]
MKKNYVLAFALSFAVLMSWQYMMGRHKPPAGEPDAPASMGAPSPEKIDRVVSPSAGAKAPDIRRENAVVFEIGDNRVTVNRWGGAVAQWEIKEAKEDAQWLTLSPVKEFAVQPLATFPDLPFEVRREGDRLLLTAKRDDGLLIEKSILVSPHSHLHQVSVTLTNRGKAPLSPTYEIGWGPGVEAGDEKGKDGREAKGFQRALAFEAPKLVHLKPGTTTRPYRWWGVDGHYFLAAFITPTGRETADVKLHVEKEEHYFSVHRVVSAQMEPGATQEETAAFYLGPKGYQNLKSLGFGLERSVDFGYFAPFGKVIHRALFTFHKVTRNYGWAIIVLTVIIQILVLPLTIKSFQHGQKMKLIQPQMKRLQELYKNDARRLNSEMLALYQRHGMRFMGMEGCVPMLIQLPVFWALFSTLRNTYELRHAPWFGWVKDLSAHDPFYVLPVLMGAGMFFQQKMSMSSVDPSQRQIMYMMPIVFTFIFLKMPAGLVIYWLTNSLVTIGVQLILMRRAAATAAAR